jgi:mannose-6-phosphate isomerase-like protein (cupin superfamily)
VRADGTCHVGAPPARSAAAEQVGLQQRNGPLLVLVSGPAQPAARVHPPDRQGRRDDGQQAARCDRFLAAPGGGFTLPHWHEDFEEVFYVLEGQIDYLTGTTWVAAGPGCTIFVPATAVHAFRNASGRTARHLAIGAPPEMVDLVRDLGTVGPSQFEAVHERYRSHFARQSPHFPRPDRRGPAAGRRAATLAPPISRASLRVMR